MYQLEIRIYVLNGEVHTTGEYRRRYKSDDELLAFTRVVSKTPDPVSSSDHHQILNEAVTVCHRIAAKLEQPLF